MSDNQYVFEIIRDIGYAVQRIPENETLWMNVKNDGGGFYTARGSDYISGGLSETSRAIEQAYKVTRGRPDPRDNVIKSLTKALKEIAAIPSVRQDECCNIDLSAIDALGEATPTESTDDKKIVVDAKALRELLIAVSGPAHYIRELQMTRNLPGDNENPIDVLIKEYNDQFNGD